jgi:hypothetical protein
LVVQVENKITASRFHGVVVSTLDSESIDPSSNLGGTLTFFLQRPRFWWQSKTLLISSYSFILPLEAAHQQQPGHISKFLRICLQYDYEQADKFTGIES